MKYFRCILLIMIFMLSNVFYITEINALDFDMVEISDSKNIMKISTEKITQNIYDFAVSENGQIAVSMLNIVNIYDENGEFLYAYDIDLSGGIIYLEYIEHYLCIYDVRLKQMFVMNQISQKLEKVYNIEDTNNNTNEWGNLYQTYLSGYKEINVKDSVYILEYNTYLYKDNILILDTSKYRKQSNYENILFVVLMIIVFLLIKYVKRINKNSENIQI